MARKRGKKVKATVRLSVVTLVGSRRISKPLVAEVEVPAKLKNTTEATFAIVREGLSRLSEECDIQYQKYLEGGIEAWEESERKIQEEENPTLTSRRKKRKKKAQR